MNVDADELPNKEVTKIIRRQAFSEWESIFHIKNGLWSRESVWK